jgi:hypothetical protein
MDGIRWRLLELNRWSRGEEVEAQARGAVTWMECEQRYLLGIGEIVDRRQRPGCEDGLTAKCGGRGEASWANCHAAEEDKRVLA